MGLISISIDIAGSTEFKKMLWDFSGADKQNISDILKEYTTIFAGNEFRFYRQLRIAGLEITNLFVPKLLGDEIWILYDMKDISEKTFQFNEGFVKIADSISDAYHVSGNISIPERRLTDEEDSDPELQRKLKWKFWNMVPKIFLDYIENYEETSGIRAEIFERRFPEFYTPIESPTVEEKGQLFSQLMERLNVGTGKTEKEFKIKYSHRFDCIGLEVDKFFRCTKFALPYLTGVGKRLFEALNLKGEPAVPKDGHCLDLGVKMGTSASWRRKSFCCGNKHIPRGKLKGIRADYDVYYFFDRVGARNIRHLAIERKVKALKPSSKYLDQIKLPHL